MRIDQKIKLLKVALVVGVAITGFALMRLMLPSLSHQRRLFNLGADYVSVDRPQMRVYYHPETTSREHVNRLVSEFKTFVDQMFELHGARLGLLRPARPITVFLHANELDYKRFWRSNERSHISSVGRYDPASMAIGISSLGELETTLTTLRHETLHLLLDISGLSGGRGGVMPTWLNEGLAEYFENGARGGTRQNYHLETPPIALDKLVRLSAKDFYDKSKPVHHHYKESALLVAMLFEGDEQKYKRRFYKYIRRHSRRRWGIAEISAEVGLSEDELTKRAWPDFLRQHDEQLSREPRLDERAPR